MNNQKLEFTGEPSNRPGLSIVENEQQKIVVTATFTAEPIEAPLKFWLKQLDLECCIEFAPYNQVFQQLLDPSSLLSNNRNGTGIILIRLEDWAKGADLTKEKIEANIKSFTLSLGNYGQKSSIPQIVCICPSLPSWNEDGINLMEQMEYLLLAELEKISGIYTISTSELLNTYPIDEYYDPHGDKIGHIPFTKSFFTSLATILARKIYTIKSRPYKVIVLDCDNTLWKGICGEDGPYGVNIDGPWKILQEFVIRQHDLGMLISICSKNNEDDVIEVFKHHQEMPLRRKHIVSWRINWDPKSENIKLLAEELQLGLDSFIFIDDNPVECAEVQANCPEVLTLQLPNQEKDIPGFLENIWAFDYLKITEEDRRRTTLYQQNIRRGQFRRESLTLADFLKDLNLEVKVSNVEQEQFSRVSQLIMRTNQFNFSNIRRSESEVLKLCQTDTVECLVTEVNDRFGDYGLVGVILFKTDAESIEVDTCLLSCRVLGRGVEYRMLAKLGNIAEERHLKCVKIHYVPSKKNKPALDFLEKIGSQYKFAHDNGFLYKFPSQYIKTLTYVPIAAKSEPAESNSNNSKISDKQVFSARRKSELLSDIAANLCTVEQIQERVQSLDRKERPDIPERYIAPETDMERTICSIWEEVLGITNIGINDNFFELNGNSLKAAQIISRLNRTINVDLSIPDLFENPAIAKLAKYIPKMCKKMQNADKKISELPIPRRNKETESLPLSSSQERLWFNEQLQPDNAADYISVGYWLRGALNFAALENSLNEIIKRHEVLRTIFPESDGKPVQVISPSLTFSITMVNLCDLSLDESAAQIQQIATEEARKPFDLAKGPLFRAKLLCMEEETHILLLTMHHIVSDGWSLGVLYRELSVLYENFSAGKGSQLPDIPIQYADYAMWEQKRLKKKFLESQYAYWKKQLGGDLPIMELPSAKLRPAIQTFRGAKYFFILNKYLYNALCEFSRNEKCTLFMTLLTAYQILLYRYTGQEDIIVGTPIANRNRSELKDLIGVFVNMLALRTDLSGNPGFRELLGRVRDVAIGAYAHQDIPFGKLVEDLQPERDPCRNPLFQVILQVSPMEELELPGLSVSPLEFDTGTAQFDLALHLYEGDEEIRGRFEYNTDLFDALAINRMVKHFQTLLEGIVSNPQQCISDLPLLMEAERHQLLVEWNNTMVEYPQDMLIHQLFEARAEKTPDAVAVVFEDRQLTYRDLNQRANRLAHYLQSMGVGPEALVGIAVERSIEMVVGLYGILKAGGAYLPIDPTYPSERIAYMLDNARAPVLLTQSKLLDKLPAQDAKVICLDAEWDNLMAGQSIETPVCKATIENPAYTIYTSGSTGKPKGVMNTHHGILNRLLWMQEAYQLTASDRVLQKTPFSFDVSVWEFFWSLMSGACLVIARPEGHRDNNYLVEIIKKRQITTIHFVPSMLQLFLEAKDVEKCNSLRQVICSGEALPLDLQNRFFEKFNVKLHNLYGPTEAAVDVTYWECRREYDFRTVPIGRPIANTRIYILDRCMQPVPIGVSGELHIGGVQVARGYLHRPDLTAEKFIPDPFSDNPKARLYRTGDLARYLPDGNIEYSGRLDHQVKVRGFRIEPGEIESVLGQHPEVSEAVVLGREDVPDDKRLVAYIVSNQQSPLSISELRNFLKEKLPDYMAPAAFMLLDALPLTPNGKVDRHALPAPEGERQTEKAYVAPRNELEKIIAGIWQELLQVEKVGVHDNFFDMGGHSLLIAQAHSRLHKVVDRDLSITDMFRYPTIEKLTEFLTREQSEGLSLEKIHDRARKQKEALNRQRQLLNKSNRSEGAGNSCQGAE